MKQTISIQGYEGSFHHEAANHYFGKDVTVLPCDTFRDAFKKAANKKFTSGGLIAIENSIAGSILPNYTLLQKNGLEIAGELYLHIRQQLLVNQDVQIQDIHEVHSHPMALMQCVDYLEKHDWRLVETEDTALSAKLVKQHHAKHVAAIAGKFAAELYGLKILTPNIHTMKNNYTRFLAIKLPGTYEKAKDANKASFYFEAKHERGSLAKILTQIAEAGMNLSKLQSFPIPGSDWKYFFHVDMEFDNVEAAKAVLEKISMQALAFQTYGMYKKGITY